MQMLSQHKFPENTLFCGDAGFVGYDFWRAIHDQGNHFLVRVGGNVRLRPQIEGVESARPPQRIASLGKSIGVPVRFLEISSNASGSKAASRVTKMKAKSCSTRSQCLTICPH